MTKTQKAFNEAREINPSAAERIMSDDSLSPFRKLDLLGYLARGFRDAVQVSSVTRFGSKVYPSESQRSNYVVEVRGATSGRWGKSRDVRFIKMD